MNKPFTILHLSDAHIGNPKYNIDSSSLFSDLIKDLSRMQEKYNIQPDLFIFSGDLAFGELSNSKIKAQYEQVNVFIQQVNSVFTTPPPLFMVPGNHDLNRNSIDESQMMYRDLLTAEKVEGIMNGKSKLTFNRFLERQQEWKEFALSHLKPFNLNEDLNFVSGKLDFNGTKICIVGLNSSWAAQGDNDLGKLWIGKHQMDYALEIIKDADFKIAVSHHPYSWLHEEDKNYVKEKLQSHFDIYLHGHEHSDWFEEQKKHLTVSAAACYQGTKKENGYDWITVDFSNKQGRLYLREYSSKGVGGWKAREIPDKTNDQGIAELDILFPQTKSSVDKPASDKPKIIFQKPIDLDGYINQLEKNFDFRWEPPTGSIEKAVVFWAVRLRTPTPIHAIQSFVAAGLQNLGCKVVLWLDDLGTTDFSVDDFFARVDKWFSKVGGQSSLLEKRQFSELYNDDKKAIFFRSFVQSWLGKNEIYDLQRVLSVSKLTEPDDQSIESSSKRKPRRILTPSMVWACLAILLDEKKDRTFITLGGYDEKPLWQAWKECVKENVRTTGHLYTPILKDQSGKPLHMETFNIGWNSRDDVHYTVQNEINQQGWDTKNHLIPWCFNLFSSLPRLVSENSSPLKVQNTEISTFDELLSLKLAKGELIDNFTNEFANWVV